jgi:lipopolysaccharide biosynthesis glycosyltransferase
MTELLRVFVGYDQAEGVAFHVLNHSIQRRASRPISVTPIILSQLKDLISRDWDPKQSNDFAYSRWLVPYLCDFQGWALFIDCDMMCRVDLAQLWDRYTQIDRWQYAVQCVQHTHIPTEKTKYLGRPQTAYSYKNWSSVMLFNCQHMRCRALTPYYINTAKGLDLHQFVWIEEDEAKRKDFIKWNHLVGVNEPDPDACLVHWTVGGPWFREYRDVEYAADWDAEYQHMIHCDQTEEALAHEG